MNQVNSVVPGSSVDAGLMAMKFNKRAGAASSSAMRRSMDRAMRIAGRKHNPIAANSADIVPWWWYDRLTTAVAVTSATEYDFFTVPIGGTKYKQDTNLEQVSRMNDPQHFNCTALKFYFASNMLKVDIDTLMNTYYMEFWIGGKVYAEGPLQLYPGGAGLSGVSAVSGQTTFTNGVPNPLAVVDFRMGDNPIGHHILQGQSFKVKVLTNAGFTTATTAAGGFGINLMCILEGILSRGVQ